ncbi:MarR family transcriptional regulator [Mucilaginibacter yixingensis]|uniref:MarR family transcriptional regulator n=1 Tax=Mucilaginibacter yixingensis TaxID=1295612 RepID=A0A2T5J8W3_9SPHI|nr:MarR family winged helix-turn-helix transcriptional regulator [Mucilaginibacter yixingensis]PTQ96523.1 MarR family transcriptional regulator [Mucilaginibacter yixingensis]
MEFGEEFGLQAMLVHKSFHSYLYQLLSETDLQHHYQVIIILIRFNGKATQKLLCEQLSVEKSNMAVIINALEAKGYVKREVNYKDRRGKLITFTSKAENAIFKLKAAFEHFEKHVLTDISWQEMYNCLSVLKKINDNLSTMNEIRLVKENLVESYGNKVEEEAEACR